MFSVQTYLIQIKHQYIFLLYSEIKSYFDNILRGTKEEQRNKTLFTVKDCWGCAKHRHL